MSLKLIQNHKKLLQKSTSSDKDVLQKCDNLLDDLKTCKHYFLQEKKLFEKLNPEEKHSRNIFNCCS